MSKTLHRLLSKLNFTAKDRAEFIKEISSSGGGGIENRVNLIEQVISEITEDSPVELGGVGYNARIYIFDDDLENNKNIVNELSLVDNYKVKYKLSETNILDCTYYNGTLTCIKDNKIVQYDVNVESGEITNSISVDPELIGVTVRLELGDSDYVAQRNRELLVKAHLQAGPHFNVDIDYGLGTADFIPQLESDMVAGHASIITNNGHFKKYDILDNGRLVESSPDIDIVEMYNIIQELK